MEQFESFQKVLVRYNVKQEWDIAFYKRQIPGEAHRVIGSQFPVSYCIPYEGNNTYLVLPIAQHNSTKNIHLVK